MGRLFPAHLQNFAYLAVLVPSYTSPAVLTGICPNVVLLGFTLRCHPLPHPATMVAFDLDKFIPDDTRDRAEALLLLGRATIERSGITLSGRRGTLPSEALETGIGHLRAALEVNSMGYCSRCVVVDAVLLFEPQVPR